MTKNTATKPAGKAASKSGSNKPGLRPPARKSAVNVKALLLGAGVVLGFGLIAAVVLSDTAGTSSTHPDLAGKVTVTGDELPLFDPKSTNQGVGQVIPEVVGSDFTGTPLSITNNGKPKILIFLAHWCPHCQAEVPKIQAWIDQNGLPEGIEMISIATSNNRGRVNFPPSEWLAREHWAVPVILDDKDSSALRAYGINQFPGFAIVGADGKIISRATGEGVLNLDAIVPNLQALVAQPAAS